MAERPDLYTIPALLARSVAERGGEDAVVSPAETLSYDQLDARTIELAAAFVALGAGKGTRIAVLVPDGVLWVGAFLAAARIGALLIPISTLATASEIAHIIRHSDAQILVAVRGFLRHDYAQRLESALLDLGEAKAGALRLAAAPYLRSIWLDDADGLGWADTHEALMARGRGGDAPDAALIRAMESEVVPSDEAIVIYTSGSTALPKAVVHTHRSASTQAQVMARNFLIRPDERIMPLLPAFWVGGLSMLLYAIQAGATLIYPGSPSTDVVFDTMVEKGATRINTWGPQLAKLREAAITRGIDPEEIVGLGDWREPDGTPIPPAYSPNMLGMTESFGPHSAEPFSTRMAEAKKGASGRVTGTYERRIVDPETGEVLPTGASGELQLRGPALMKGYYKVDADKVFTPDGFYPTSDVCHIDADGYLWFEGRRGDMLKTAGANVSRLEVEAALRSLLDVELPIVMGIPDEEIGQVVVAAVVPKDGHSPTEASLQAALRDKLSTYKIPRRIFVIGPDEVIWAPSNKIRLADMVKAFAARVAAEPAARVAS